MGGDPFALECKKNFNTKLINSGTNQFILTRNNPKSVCSEKNLIKPLENDENWPKNIKTKVLLNGLKIGFMDKTYIHKFLFAQFIYYFYEKFIYLHFITFKHKQNEPSNNRFLPLFNHIPWPFMGP